MQLHLFCTPFCTISAPFPPSSCPFSAISPLLYSLILRHLSIKYHIMKTYFNVIIPFHENTLFYVRFTPQKKLPAGGIPTILRGAFTNTYENVYLRRRRAAKPASANRLSVAVVGSGIARNTKLIPSPAYLSLAAGLRTTNPY